MIAALSATVIADSLIYAEGANVKLISTKIHGVLDYVTVASLLTLPRILGWHRDVTRLMTGSALGTRVLAVFLLSGHYVY